MNTEFPENQPTNQLPEDSQANDDPSQDNDNLLNQKTQALLDHLDDDIENDEKPQDPATAELLQTLDALKPQTVTPSPDSEAIDGVPDQQQDAVYVDADVQSRNDVSDEEIGMDEDSGTTPSKLGHMTQETEDGVPDTLQEQHSENAIPPTIIETEPEQNYRYRIAVTLPTLLQAAIDEALEEVELIEEKQTGAFQWQAAFLCDEPQTVANTLDEWVQNNLPIPTKTERVHSEIAGTQTYIGGWALSNSDAIYKAQEKLTTQLVDIITPETDEDATFRAILPVHNEVPANRFPQLIGHLQRRLKAEAWKIEAIELLRLPLDKKGNPEPDAVWSVMGTFRPEM